MQFSEIIGLENVKRSLIENAREGRVSHAQLFLGDEGSGNLPLALAYATFIFCENKQENDSCGECANCLKIKNLAHPDLHFTFPFVASSSSDTCKEYLPSWRDALKTNPYLDYDEWLAALGAETKQALINKEEGLDILRKVTLKAYEGGYKISIIWKPETLHVSSANALLKIIEEPPANTIFLFVANNIEEVLPTILSRTQLVKTGRIPVDILAAELQKRYDMSSEQATSLAITAEGNFLDATRQLGKNGQDLVVFENFRNWMRLCYQPKDLRDLNDWVEENAKLGRERLKQFISYALFISRQCILKHYLGIDKLSVRGDELDFVQKFSPFINERNILEMSGQMDEAYRDISRNANPKIVLLDLSFKTIVLLKK